MPIKLVKLETKRKKKMSENVKLNVMIYFYTYCRFQN